MNLRTKLIKQYFNICKTERQTDKPIKTENY